MSSYLTLRGVPTKKNGPNMSKMAMLELKNVFNGFQHLVTVFKYY